VELFEEIRREYEFGIASIAGMARKFGVHRRLVREALRSAVPQQRPVPARPRPTIGPVAEFIDGILEADRRAPRKQRHTAHRIWVRITKERSGYQIAESTVRQYVRLRKQALGLRVAPEPCVPQQYAWGDEAQVDWYEADADLDGERQTVQVFALRSMASGAAFHRAYPRATQQAFLDPWLLSNALADLGFMAQQQANYQAAQAHFDEALAAARTAGDQVIEAITLSLLGWLALVQEAYPRARARCE
jgi:hypothetical protein